MTTKEVVETFFAAWTTRNETAARALVADDIVYTNPLQTFRSADEFVPRLLGFAKTMRGAPIHELVIDGDRAAMLYDCDMPPPIGMLRTAWFLRVEGGKIRRIDSLFDASEIRKLERLPSEG